MGEVYKMYSFGCVPLNISYCVCPERACQTSPGHRPHYTSHLNHVNHVILSENILLLLTAYLVPAPLV
jgi:hypothetical protein